MNLNIWQIIFLAVLQGVTELFPISSLGHSVIIPGLLGWGISSMIQVVAGKVAFYLSL